MKRWYFPSWHGDLRLERAEVPEETLLTIEKPTADEQRLLNKMGPVFVEKGWLDSWSVEAPKKRLLGRSKRTVRLKAPLEAVGAVVAPIFRPGPAVLTAIKLSDGHVEVVTEGGLEKGEGALPGVEPAALVAPASPAVAPKVAATVKRPTPCCPACVPGAVGPASEVLLAFLDEEQHAQWAEERALVCYGGLTGRPYVLAHRHTERARRQGRICQDLLTGKILHFHDWTVPPEEEVLAAKLILEHREPWLRNEATYFGLFKKAEEQFKNPFGDEMDGRPDSIFTERLGESIAELMGLRGRDLGGGFRKNAFGDELMQVPGLDEEVRIVYGPPRQGT